MSSRSNVFRMLRFGLTAGAVSAMMLVESATAAPPTFIQIFLGNGFITVAWIRTSTTGSYKVYRSTTSGDANAAAVATVTPTRTLPCMENCTTPGGLGNTDCGDKMSDLFLVDFPDSAVTNGTKYYYTISYGTETAKSAEVSATPAASTTITKSRYLKIMPMGNSITNGYVGDCNQYGSYRDSLSRMLKKNGYQFGFTGASLDNSRPRGGAFIEFPNHEGYPDRMVVDLYKQVVPYAIPSYRPDIVLLEIGTNDCVFFNQYLGQSPGYFDSLVSRVHAISPSTHIIVTPIPPYGTDTVSDWGKQMNSYIKKYNADIKSVVQKKQAAGKRISWLSEMEAHVWSQNDFISGDVVHPNMDLHHKAAGMWYRAIDALANGTPVLSPPMTQVRQAAFIQIRTGIIAVSIDAGSPVTLSVVTPSGKLVARETLTPRNGKVELSRRVKTGVYVVTARTRDSAPTRSVIAVR